MCFNLILFLHLFRSPYSKTHHFLNWQRLNACQALPFFDPVFYVVFFSFVIRSGADWVCLVNVKWCKNKIQISLLTQSLTIRYCVANDRINWQSHTIQLSTTMLRLFFYFSLVFSSSSFMFSVFSVDHRVFFFTNFDRLYFLNSDYFRAFEKVYHTN